MLRRFARRATYIHARGGLTRPAPQFTSVVRWPVRLGEHEFCGTADGSELPVWPHPPGAGAGGEGRGRVLGDEVRGGARRGLRRTVENGGI